MTDLIGFASFIAFIFALLACLLVLCIRQQGQRIQGLLGEVASLRWKAHHDYRNRIVDRATGGPVVLHPGHSVRLCYDHVWQAWVQTPHDTQEKAS